MKTYSPILLPLSWIAFALAPAPGVYAQLAPAAATGTIQGRVLNARNGEYLERARIKVEGTTLETFTDNSGFFQLTQVPAGSARVNAFFTGLDVRTDTIFVQSGRTVRHDFTLSATDPARPPGSNEVVTLSEFVVGASREMEGSAIAINERRFAPNLQSVMSTDEFGAIPDGSVGEFLKFVPGVNIDYTGGVANTISIDGVPPGNVPVTLAGFNLATPASGDRSARQNELLQVSINNISRVEVVLSPTPESPGSALAGSVNFVPRSAFEYVHPQFNFNTYVLMRDDEKSLRKTPGPRHDRTHKIQPGFDLSYIRPVNERFGFTLAAGYGNQYTSEERSTTQWRGAGAATNPGAGLPDTTPDQPYLTTYSFNDHVKFNGRASASATLDFKFSSHDRVSLAVTYGSFTSEWTFNVLTFQINRVNPGGFTAFSTRSQPGEGELRQTQAESMREGTTITPTLIYRHDGPIWKAESGLGFSQGKDKSLSLDHGFFVNSLMRRTNVTISFDDIFYLRPRVISVTDPASGAAVDPYALNSYVLASADGNLVARTIDVQRSAYANLRREFEWAGVPLTLKAGCDFRNQIRDSQLDTQSYSFRGADRRATTTPVDPLGSDDGAAVVLNEQISKRSQPFGFPRVQWPSNDRLWSLYQANPGYFSLDENSSYRSAVTNSRRAEELISSVYVRADAAFFSRRLRLTGGVRAEQTNVQAEGPLTDPVRNYQRDGSGNIVPRRDASGRIVLGANGQPLPALIVPTTDALGVSRLTYVDRGYNVDKEYLRFFPSLNATYSLRENLLLKAAHYYSLGRPIFSQYSGGLTLPDTEAAPSSTNRISVNNAGIKPWTARTTKVRAEFYFQRGASQISVGAFRRDYENFFGSTTFPATSEFLALYGLDSQEYLGFNVATNYNLQDTVRAQGLEAEFNQTLAFLPSWFGTVQVRGNVSALRYLGPAAANFANFVPRTFNAMIFMKKPRYSLRAGWNYTSIRRGGLVTGRSIEPGTFSWVSPRLYLDVGGQYFLTKKISLYVNLRNVNDAPQDSETFGPSTPSHAQFRTRSQFGSLWTFGVSGNF